MGKLIGDVGPSPKTLAKLRDLGDRGQRWYAYQNHDLGSREIGRLRFLKVGPDCTFRVPPDRYPDTPEVIGWRYLLVGIVNLETGKIEEVDHA